MLTQIHYSHFRINSTAAPADGRADRAGPGDWPRFDFVALGPQFVSASGSSDWMRRSVDQAGNVDLQVDCSSCSFVANRACKPSRTGQGRPVGKLLAACGIACGGDVAQHIRHPSLPSRILARCWGESCSAFVSFLDSCERFKDASLDDMVSGAPYKIP